jgi:protein-S-isoprenylcysteine O-methyltransferase Ste14
LRRRLAAGPAAETERRQKVIQAIASIAFAGIFLVAGLDHRLGWSNVSVLRLLDEERFLSQRLPGYAEYLSKIKYRLIPFIW